MRWWCVLPLVTACSGSDSAATCGNEDYECWLDHLVVKQNGDPVELVRVEQLPDPGGGSAISGTVYFVDGTTGNVISWRGSYQDENVPTPIGGGGYMGVGGTVGVGYVVLAGANGISSRLVSGGAWTGVGGLPTGDNFEGVSTNSGAIYTVGSNGNNVGAFCGLSSATASWACEAITAPILRDVWIAPTGEVFVVGGQGPGYAGERVNGVWADLSGATIGYSVWGSAANNVWIAGAELQHWDGAMLMTAPITHQFGFRAVGGSAANDVWVSEDYVGVRHFDGVSWSAVMPLPNRVLGIWAHSPTDAWAVGEHMIRHWNGTTWEQFAGEPDGMWYGVYADGPSAPPVGMATSAPPSITSISPTTFSIDSTSALVDVTIDWTDPGGAQPPFCFSPCSKGARCLGPARCSRLIPDGLKFGRTIYQLGFSALAEGPDAATPTISTAPLGSSDGNDPLANPSSAISGTHKTLEVTIEPKPMTTSGGTCSGGFKGSFSYCLGSSSSCQCNGNSKDLCITDANFSMVGDNNPRPASCKAKGEVDCVNLDGKLVNPCCPGLSCVQGIACAPDAPDVQGNGICWPVNL